MKELNVTFDHARAHGVGMGTNTTMRYSALTAQDETTGLRLLAKIGRSLSWLVVGIEPGTHKLLPPPLPQKYYTHWTQKLSPQLFSPLYPIVNLLGKNHFVGSLS